MNAIALPTTVIDLIDEYQRKQASMEASVDAVKASFAKLHTNCCVQGAYVDSLPSAPSMHTGTLSKNLLKSGWRAAYNRLRIADIASAKDKKLFDQAIADPPPFIMENIKATFGDYFERPRFHILKGLAEVFTSLDPSYKSHSKVKIGVKGLPKRIIMSGWGEYRTGWGVDRFIDMVNALATVQGRPHIPWDDLDRLFGKGVHSRPIIFEDRGISVLRYLNGNAHVIFDKDALRDINMALAEFYGDVLPDVEEDGLPRQTSTAVSKDLQFYWSPPKVIDFALDFAGLPTISQRGSHNHNSDIRVLEPSCGDGRILDELRARGYRSLGIEFDPSRAAQAKLNGHSVINCNFLEHPPTPDFTHIVMNPPFYGKHYAKHVRHALQFLKAGGTLVAILPSTARYDHSELNDIISKSPFSDSWRDLPVASFAEVGTNVPTSMLRINKQVAA